MVSVLIADDDLFYRSMLSKWVMAMGHEVVWAHSGMEALELCDTREFDLMILDVFMEKMTGLEVLTKMTKAAEINATKRIPVVVITSDESVHTEMAARKEKATFYLLKPFSMEFLVSVVEEAVKTAALQP